MMTKPGDKDVGKKMSIATPDEVVTSSIASRSYSRSLSHISESSADGITLMDKPAGESGEVMSLVSGLSVIDIQMEIPSRTPELSSSSPSDADLSPRRLDGSDQNTSADSVKGQHQNEKKQDTSRSVHTSSSPRTDEGGTQAQKNTDPHLECNMLPKSGDGTYVARRVSVEEDVPGTGAVERDGPGDSGLEEAFGAVVSTLDDYRGQFPELQLLEQELKLLQGTLKVRKEDVCEGRKVG